MLCERCKYYNGDKKACYASIKPKEILTPLYSCERYVPTNDMVIKPAHYANHCSIECIESMDIAFGNEYMAVFCLINAYKYLWRRKAKNGLQDVRKALWYLDRYQTYRDNLPTEACYTLDNQASVLTTIAKKAESEYKNEEDK